MSITGRTSGEAEAEDAALKVATEFFLDITRHGPNISVPPCEPALEVLRHILWSGVFSGRRRS
jgi:hypothetical protein